MHPICINFQPGFISIIQNALLEKTALFLKRKSLDIYLYLAWLFYPPVALYVDLVLGFCKINKDQGYS